MIDVLICAYNAKEFIGDTLDSLAKQTIKDKLFITIVDDGSKEKYDDIIKNYNNKLNIQIIRLKRNHGLGYAREISISRTYNDYFFIIDADDILIDNKAIEYLYAIALSNPYYKLIIGKEQTVDKTDYHLTHMQSKLYKREAIDKYKIKVPAVRMEEDANFSLSLISLLEKDEIKYVDKVIYQYRKINPKALTNIYSVSNGYADEAYFKAMDYAYKYVKKYRKYDNFKIILVEHIERFNNTYYKKYYHSNNEIRNKFLLNCHKFYLKYNKYLDLIYTMGKNIHDKDDYSKVIKFYKMIKNYKGEI